MKKITVKEYAKLNRVSIYSVIKKIQRGELEGVTLEENGQRVNYVVLDDAKTGDDPLPVSEQKRPLEPSGSERPDSPAGEIALLREEVARLRRLVERCCKER
ncbi:hypothetical protein [Hydrogenimonas urashimensis]|uniref:hypothetical protein n=1 Tax=Hydrogenimonas urashimensis TaxID=2740515 RepID=UPI0019166BD2|nr:hypothetical protein [Hydrogenimonas urashimensis]